jgi:restriction endonuclease Mrr
MTLPKKMSRNGGIDGIINKDELGLDAVYVHTKLYAADNNVGVRPRRAYLLRSVEEDYFSDT